MTLREVTQEMLICTHHHPEEEEDCGALHLALICLEMQMELLQADGYCISSTQAFILGGLESVFKAF